MRYTVGFLTFLISLAAAADCGWSESYPIPNENILRFQECKADKKIRIGQIEVQPNIDFEIVHSYYPEGNTIWSAHSPDEKTAVVYIENADYERNAWVIDLTTNAVLLFIDHVEGKHFTVEFDRDDRFRIIHAGMGYRTDYHYKRVSGIWTNAGHEKIDVDWK